MEKRISPVYKSLHWFAWELGKWVFHFTNNWYVLKVEQIVSSIYLFRVLVFCFAYLVELFFLFDPYSMCYLLPFASTSPIYNTHPSDPLTFSCKIYSASRLDNVLQTIKSIKSINLYLLLINEQLLKTFMQDACIEAVGYFHFQNSTYIKFLPLMTSGLCLQ